MKNEYIYWGYINNDVKIDSNIFVFISAFSEFIGTFIFISLLLLLVSNFLVIKNKKDEKNAFFIICLGIFFVLVIAFFITGIIQWWVFSKIYNANIPFGSCGLVFNPAFVIIDIFKGINYLNSNDYIPIGNGIIYILFEVLGGFLASFVSYFAYKNFFIKESNNILRRCCFYTRNNEYDDKAFKTNLGAFGIEVFAAIILCASINATLLISNYVSQIDPQFNFIIISLIVSGVCIATGKVTGPALNPVRDLMPRITYYIMFKKVDPSCKNDWNYAWIPCVAPLVGVLIGSMIMPGFLY